ncbi:MAG: YfcE family phosphodiesterase [Candidatus Thorarchaeota archaeon]|nr:YfcE family phosphodiesterase [Candidatus Thorarchaeota archaeon]
MQRILVFGDLHVPTRRDSIPDTFARRIAATTYDLALVTGDLVEESEMREIMPPLPQCYIVQGNMDFGSHYEFHHEVRIEDLNFLLLHGTQLRPRGNLDQLWEILLNIDVDVAVHGHTHVPSIDLHRDRLFINPGTITGATGGRGGRKAASFIELEVSGTQIDVTLYITDWHVVKETTLSFQRLGDKMIRVNR